MISRIASLLIVMGLLTNTAQAFPDTQNYWAKDCIESLRTSGFVGYPDGEFRPDNPVSRAEFATMIATVFKSFSFEKNPPLNFTDVPENFWATTPINTTSSWRIFVGYPDGRFRPNASITRLETLLVLRRATDFTALEEPKTLLSDYFQDADEIPAYAEEAIADVAVGRLIVNYPRVNQLRPQAFATRGEVAAFICQATRRGEVIPLEFIAKGSQDPFVIPPELGIVGGFTPDSEGLALAYQRGRYGYVNTQGEWVIPPQFEWARSFSEGLAVVRKDQKIFCIDVQGNLALSPDFGECQSDFSDGVSRVRLKNGQNGIMDRQGNLLFETPHYIDAFSEGLARIKVREDSTQAVIGNGFVNKQGEMVIEPRFEDAGTFSQGRAMIQENGQWGFINRTGTIVAEPEFREVQAFTEGLAAVKKGDLWGYIDSEGEMVISPQFEIVQPFSEGLAGVKKGDRWFYINTEGNPVIEGDFRVVDYAKVPAIEPFSEGLAVVRVGEKAGIINKAGEFVVQPTFVNIIGPVVDSLVMVNVGGRWTTEVVGTNIPPNFPTRAIVTGGRVGYIRVPES
ncbi:MAG: WG repeat-containing protein [Cyanobacteria bacterium J06592_8]